MFLEMGLYRKANYAFMFLGLIQIYVDQQFLCTFCSSWDRILWLEQYDLLWFCNHAFYMSYFPLRSTKRSLFIYILYKYINNFHISQFCRIKCDEIEFPPCSNRNKYYLHYHICCNQNFFLMTMFFHNGIKIIEYLFLKEEILWRFCYNELFRGTRTIYTFT